MGTTNDEVELRFTVGDSQRIQRSTEYLFEISSSFVLDKWCSVDFTMLHIQRRGEFTN